MSKEDKEGLFGVIEQSECEIKKKKNYMSLGVHGQVSITLHKTRWAESSKFVSSSIPS